MPDGFGAALRRLREAQELTQVECARRAGRSATTWVRWETGPTLPEVRGLRDIAVALDLEPIELGGLILEPAGMRRAATWRDCE